LLFLTSVYLSAAILLAGAEIVLAMPMLRVGDFDPVPDPLAPKRPFLARALRDVLKFIRGLFVANREAPRAPGRERRWGRREAMLTFAQRRRWRDAGSAEQGTAQRGPRYNGIELHRRREGHPPLPRLFDP